MSLLEISEMSLLMFKANVTYENYIIQCDIIIWNFSKQNILWFTVISIFFIDNCIKIRISRTKFFTENMFEKIKL